MKSLESNILESATLFTLTLRAWGNRAKGSLEDASFYTGGVDDNAENQEPDKRRLSLSKRLIKSPEYKAIKTKQHELKAWCMERCMPRASGDFSKGFPPTTGSLSPRLAYPC